MKRYEIRNYDAWPGKYHRVEDYADKQEAIKRMIFLQDTSGGDHQVWKVSEKKVAG